MGSSRSRRILTSSDAYLVEPQRGHAVESRGTAATFRNSRSGSFQKTIRCPFLVEEAVEGLVDLVQVAHAWPYQIRVMP